MKAQKTLRRKELTVAISLLLAASGSALAQDQVDAQDSDDEMVVEEVIVTGLRKSIIDSLNLKKGSQMIVEAVSAEDIGKLPDLSIPD